MKPIISTIVHNSADYAKAVKLRTEILRKPLGMSYTAAQLAAESADIHLVACIGKQIVGTLTVTQSAPGVIKLRQMAVAKNRQKSGIGQALIAYAEELAIEMNTHLIFLHARETAIGFYERLGYTPVGKPFMEVSLPHHRLEKSMIPG